MRIAILLLIALLGLSLGFLIYRALIHSVKFARLIGGAVEPTPETPDEVMQRLKDAKANALKRAGHYTSDACKSKDAAAAIRRELRRNRPKL